MRAPELPEQLQGLPEPVLFLPLLLLVQAREPAAELLS